MTATDIKSNDTLVERGKAENDRGLLRVGQHDGYE